MSGNEKSQGQGQSGDKTGVDKLNEQTPYQPAIDGGRAGSLQGISVIGFRGMLIFVFVTVHVSQQLTQIGYLWIINNRFEPV